MTFANPAALWAFLSIFPLIALYFFKVRPQKKSTSALFLWNQIFEEKKQNGLFKNLRDLISLLILLLAFAAIILAMAKPTINWDDQTQNLVIIIDNSASMANLEEGKSRLDLAKARAENIVKSLSSSQTALITSISDSLQINVDSTSNRRSLLKGIDGIAQSQAPLKSQELSAITKNKGIIPNSRFIFISDSCFQGYQETAELELLKIGSKTSNIGITAFDIRPIPGKQNQLGIFFQVFSSYEQRQELELHLAQGEADQIVKIIPITIEPGLNAAKVLYLKDSRYGAWFLKLLVSDSLASDNIAYAQVDPPSPVRIQLDLDKNEAFFQRCVDSFHSAGQVMKAVNQSPEIIISSNGKNTGVNKIIFAPKGKSPFWEGDASPLESATPRVLLADHPAIKFCPLDTLDFEGAQKISAPENSIILVESTDHTPLLYKTTVDNTTAFVINMDPAKAQLYFNIYFPVMIYSLSYDLIGRDTLKKSNYLTGEILNISSPQKLIGPKGPKDTINNLAKLNEAGFYSITSDKKEEQIAVSLNNKFESRIFNTLSQSTVKAIDSSFPISDALMILALVLICSEAMLYHRRKLG
ncbi:BatA and WFA domain-containing protein [Lentisphaera profundi]|uniref:BatA and WFA domain-containing protein n=1 Tax=Lentisphaera profundi TaxID=1658616 RepID=A0ABY7VYV5_9BACT|nr:BatA and WFA domain-containing protein [Lentisphaera profundi]WDE97961.1 BatA and WFA domain-containing protein [Lentisphaera profundi]